jgi:anti-sigma regulatory factor (Ser/Thr protein kinase)
MVRRRDERYRNCPPLMPDGLPTSFQLYVPTDLVFVRPVRKMLEALLYAQGWEEDDVDDAGLIVTEIVQNAVEHGSLADGEERITVTILALGDAVEIEVLDPGTGSDPALAIERDVEAPVPMDQPRGRGLFLIHRLAGQFERSLADQGGLCIRARKESSS